LEISSLNYEQKKLTSALLYEYEVRKSRQSLLGFTKATLDNFEIEPFHKQYYTLLDRFAKGNIKRLIITMPPQHGKSEGSTRRLPAYILGLNPNKKIAVASYNTTFASKFNRDIQRIIDTTIYNDIFPETTLNKSNVVTVASNYLRNSLEFEIVNKKGGLKSVGRGGPLTGNKVDVMIMDDLYKDYMEGNSPIIRDTVWDWYTSVVTTRLHNNSQQLIVFTRWHEDDLIGRLESKGKVKEITNIDNIDQIDLKHDEWLKVNFEAIKESEKTMIDPREKGESLWENMHSLESLTSSRELDIEKFSCLYQGDPQTAEGMLYSKFKTYRELPELKIIKNYTDTADTGKDRLCSIVYGIPVAKTDKHIYVLDVLYTSDPMEVTEPKTINLLNSNEVNEAHIESNNGGRGFARVIEKGVNKTNIFWFHQSNNKEARIFSNSASVNNKIVFPSDWGLRWSEFYNDVTKYKKLFKANKFDDAPDTLTGIIEKEEIPEVFTF
jgi:predicted phage terminase large subunit-like protein